MPVPSRVLQSGTVFTITDGSQAGINLFHSFSQFSVPTGSSAIFNTSQYSGIQNIFSRITGKSVSTIDGSLQLQPTGANLFLLNPNGFIFGPNARLNIGGSFLATTGNNIRFADGTEFSATTSSPPVLTVSVPVGVQFGADPGSIQVNGSSLRTPGQTFGLLGGNISTTGGASGIAGNDIIQALSGRLELGSVTGGSFVSLNLVNRGFTLGYNQANNFQDINIQQNSSITASNGGSVQIQGRRVQLSGGSQITTVNALTSILPGGSLSINASESLEILGTGFYAINPSENPTGLFNRTRGSQSAGSIFINTLRLRVTDGGQISAETFSSGQGGNIIINAPELVEVSGVSATNPRNLFGNISVASRNPNRTNLSTGNAGSLIINTNILNVKNGGQISATTFGNGSGGNLTINADTVQLIGGSNNRVNGLFAQSGSSDSSVNNPDAKGQGGNLSINAGSLLVQDGSLISTRTFTAGNAGNLVVNAGEVTVAGRSLSDQSPSLISASSVSAGAAGNLSIFADRVTVKDGGAIAVSGTGSGVAGNLQLNSPFILLENQGKLLAETRAGQGNITLNTSDLRLRYNSLISTNATGRATGGNISIFTQTLAAFENSDITANAEESFGGRVTIRAAAIFGTEFRLLLTPESDITATSALGPDFSGSVTLQTLGIDPSQGIVQLESDILDLSQLVVAACSPGSQQATGEFFVTGKGGLPTTPGESATDSRILIDLGESGSYSQTSPLVSKPPSQDTNTQALVDKNQILQAQGWIINADGKIVLTAQSPSSHSKQSSLLFPICNQQN